MNFLIDLLKRATKGDNFRPSDSPIKYNDKIAQLNTTSNNQYNRLNTSTINRMKNTTSTLTQSTTNRSVLPGS